MRDIATSAIWNVVYLAWLTTLAPILISLSRKVVSDQCLILLGSPNRLRKILNDHGFTIREPTFSRHLDHLEKKKLIVRDRSKHKTAIRLINEDLFVKFLNKDFENILNEYSDIIENAKELSHEEIYEKLKWYSINKAYRSLYIQLQSILNQEKKGAMDIMLKWINLTHDNIINLYLSELENRIINEKIEVMNLLLKDGK